MNTGAQLSYSTPFGHRTSTSEVGKSLSGKRYHHKDTAQIFAACHVPFVFTASDGYPEDLMHKVAKAQWYAKNEGLVYGKILSYCPLNWRTADDAAPPVLQAAIPGHQILPHRRPAHRRVGETGTIRHAPRARGRGTHSDHDRRL
jgi:pyruvate ferredoxin oxidoreductase alpha subunit